MTQNNVKILFITPGATSAGGNIFLLRFLRWFKSKSAIPFVTLYRCGGVLEKDFAALSKTYKFDLTDKSDDFFKKSIKKVSVQIGLNQKRIKSQIRRENIRLIYSNTVINCEMLSMFADLNVPVISHCHELESVIHLTGVEGFLKTVELTSHFVAVSNAVRDNLTENYDIPPAKISLVYGFIPIEKVAFAQSKQVKANVHTELRIPENAFIVGASGTLNWRKAPEIFISLAAKISEKSPDAPIYFVWIGGAEKGDFALYQANHDLRKLGLENRVFFLEHKENPIEYFAGIDVFAMVSREDPFPLVCLESASLGKPIICFANASGISEFVEDDAGFVVPYFDIEIFADKVLEFYKNPRLKEQLGRKAVEKVRANHDILKSAPEILEIIERFIN